LTGNVCSQNNSTFVHEAGKSTVFPNGMTTEIYYKKHFKYLQNKPQKVFFHA